MQSFGVKGRLEDERMLKGRGRYVSDWTFPRQLHAQFVRSDRPHAKIVSIDAAAALAMPGVVAVLTGEDVAASGAQGLPAAAPVKARDGSEQPKVHHPALAQGRVRHVGEAVAAVLPTDRYLAEDAAAPGDVDYRPPPAPTGFRRARAPAPAKTSANVPIASAASARASGGTARARTTPPPPPRRRPPPHAPRRGVPPPQPGPAASPRLAPGPGRRYRKDHRTLPAPRARALCPPARPRRPGP